MTEIKGDDVNGFISLIRQTRRELNHLPLVYASTPDFKDAFQEGWAKAVTRMVETLVMDARTLGKTLPEIPSPPAPLPRGERGSPAAPVEKASPSPLAGERTGGGGCP